MSSDLSRHAMAVLREREAQRIAERDGIDPLQAYRFLQAKEAMRRRATVNH